MAVGRRVDPVLTEYFIRMMELTAETKYQLLAQISHEIRDTLDLDEILNHLLDMVGSIVQYDAAGIFVLNEDLVHRGNNRPRALIAGISLRGFDPRPNGIDPMLREGKGIIGHVIKTGECVVAPDIRKDPHYLEGREHTLSEIAVPIVRNGRAIGTLNLESDRLDAFGCDDVEVLRFFADAASISIEKAIMHRQILEKERIEEQLKVASNVQARLLPESSPVVPGYEIAGTCLSTYDIGGDYFDYIELPNGDLGIVVADVSGHGIPAALIMAAFRRCHEAASTRFHRRGELRYMRIRSPESGGRQFQLCQLRAHTSGTDARRRTHRGAESGRTGLQRRHRVRILLRVRHCVGSG
jgi:sigma-B regulation protein RsbU (phosphoserine phosphatase)